MVSVQTAKNIINGHVIALPPSLHSLEKAAGLVLAEDVYARLDIPAFPQSAMDGYALSWKGWQTNKKLRIKGELPAGHDLQLELDPANAIRIFTGAAVPPGADTVVMQEKTKVSNDELLIEDENLQPGINVRPKGSELKAGELALPKGSLLTPAAIGFLAGIGIKEVNVYPHPVISILVTGKELQEPGTPLTYGKVYESNSFMLAGALRQMHIEDVKINWVDDDPAILTSILKTSLATSDVVILTGGISVGDYDFVLESANACGVEKLFHKVKQKPGKPFYAGKKDQKLVFGLPGNPASVLTCFYQYVRPALGKLSKQNAALPVVEASLGRALKKAPGLTHFLKAWYDGQIVNPLDAQESYRLHSFARANCLLQLDEEGVEFNQGDKLTIHLLPN
ncbi:MAG TPA: gephyrin-like molybdotransferase Glp [Chitinophagaceae bacterium]|nr:gephyrin-like molybdotransferase Glp [Chitinophagaceae bacterium]